MSGAIYLLQHDGTLIAMESQPCDSEQLLQQLLAQHTHLLGGEQMDLETPRRWLLVSREFPLPDEEGGGRRWSVDHLFLDQDGVPTIVEVKRCSDPRIRREVVGQMLDYAANAVVYWPVENIRARYEGGHADSDQRMIEFLGEDADPEEFWQRVKTNRQAGRVRLVFVADRIPSELRRVVEFLNTQMDPAEVFALEIEQFVGSGLTTLVPRIIGQTAEAERRKGRARRFNETDRIHLLTETCPYPDGTKKAATWQLCKEGQTVADYRTAGGKLADLSRMERYKRISVG
jgi:hypothetical protein